MRYVVVYADPPWPYDNMQNCDPKRGGITYPVMSLDEIKALPVASICAKDAVVFLWATMPKLREALEVIEAWGFRYVTCAFVWIKLNPSGRGLYSGLGYWTNGNAELCLLGKRGHPKRVARNVKQVVIAPRGRHSAKPPEVRERIVELMGDVPRIELFARERVPGWDAWGNEVDCDIILAPKGEDAGGSPNKTKLHQLCLFELEPARGVGVLAEEDAYRDNLGR